MKKYIAIFELFARSTIYKILPVFALMGAAQVFMFQKAMSEWFPMDAYHLEFQAIEYYTLEYMMSRSKNEIFLGIAFVLITAILCWNGCNIGSKAVIPYSVCRLRKREFLSCKAFITVCVMCCF